MKKLIVLALVALAVWYGWKHYPELLNRAPANDAVIENRSGRGMARIRLTVDGQTFVKEELADGADAVIPFRVRNDSSFELVWTWGDTYEHQWAGGLVPHGPMVQRHVMTVNDDGVFYRAEPKFAPTKG